MRAVIYARVSGDDRNNSTSSLEGQLEECRGFAESNGWQVVEELAEDSRGASGASFDLPQLNRALAMANAGDFDVLVTREIDRLARNLAKQLVIEREFEQLGVDIEYVIGDYQNTPEGQLSKHIRAVIAEYEREKINERMVRGRRRKAKSGYVVLHGNTPYGYSAVEEDSGIRLIIEEETAEVIRMIFKWYTEDGWGTPRIARELNRLGVPTPSVAKNTKAPHAKGWNQAQVMRFIKNETYAGIWKYGKRNRSGSNPSDYHIDVDVPAIVSREVFKLAQQKRKSNRKWARRATKHEYLLARRCICGECQAPLTAYTKHRRKRPVSYGYYRCPVPHSQGSHYMYKTCSMTTNFRADYWDDAVWNEVKSFLVDPENLVAGFERYEKEISLANEPLRKRIEVIDDLLEKKNRELTRLLDLFLTGEFEKEMLQDRKRQLEDTIAALRDEKQELQAQLKQTLTRKQVMEIRDFSQQVTQGIMATEDDFAAKQRVLDYLGVQVSFLLEEGQQVAYVYFELGPDHDRRLSKVGKHKLNQTSSHLRESVQSASSPQAGEDNYMPNYKHSTGCRRN